MKHSYFSKRADSHPFSFWKLMNYREVFLYEEKDLKEMIIVQGMSISADDESGLGVCHLHATPNFYNTNKPRYDFVEVEVELEDDTTTEIKKGKVLAQVITFLAVREIESATKKYYALVQYLQEEKTVKEVKKKVPHATTIIKHRSMFKKYQWEYTNYGGESRYQVINVDVISIDSITQGAFVIPDFSSISNGNVMVRDDYQNEEEKSDRYWYVPRKFTDRSEWTKSVDVRWTSYEEFDYLTEERLQELEDQAQDNNQDEDQEINRDIPRRNWKQSLPYDLDLG
jgi:hypothetical protein